MDNSPHHQTIFNFESATEIARLLLQDRIFSQAIGTTVFFSSQGKSQSDLHRVLDIGCGPGGWAIDLARQLPQTKVIGIDSSPTMRTYASGLAKLHHLQNCQFHVMDALKPLAFSDRSVDLVNIRTISTSIPKNIWSVLLKECHRILCRGGSLQLMEYGGMTTDSAALEVYGRFCIRSLFQHGYGFQTPDESFTWMTPQIGKHLLRQAGYQRMTSHSFLLDFSTGSPLHEPQCQSIEALFAVLQPALIRANIVPLAELEKAYEAVKEDVSRPSFHASLTFHLICGERRA